MSWPIVGSFLVILLLETTQCQRPPVIIDPTAAWAQNNTRLPTDVVPLNYDLILQPNLEFGNFTGNVSILLTITTARTDIYLHQKLLNVSSVDLFGLSAAAPNDSVILNPSTATSVAIRQHFPYNTNELYIIQLEATAAPGRYVLNMGFNGTMLNKLSGLFRSSYQNINNVTRYLAVTQFENTDARAAFPCFDQPNIKSTFNITVIHTPDVFALSNMPASDTIQNVASGLMISRFDRSVPMPTYLVAIVVCDFNYIETYSSDGVRIRVYATPEQIGKNNAQFTLLVTNNSLAVYSVYFDIPYHLPKLDIVAIPDFWDEGAMENYGLITVREYYGLFDPSESSDEMRLTVAGIIAHEVAHQWTGDLVTMDWWTNIWLNEGFAERMQYIGVLGIEPDWPISDIFVTDELQPALKADSIAASRPIIPTHLNDFDMFDSITYSKGASVIRMLANVMGPEPFRLGISNYLKAHFLGNANSDDLYSALAAQLLITGGCSALNATCPGTSNVTSNEYGAGSQCINVKQMMDSWTTQENYPILHLESVNFTHGRIRQQRFLVDLDRANQTDPRDASSFNYTWFVPVTYELIGNTARKRLLWTTPEISGEFQWPSSNRLYTRSQTSILFNAGQNGFYRINYPMGHWHSLASLLTTNVNALPNARDRAGLLSDAFQLARAGIIPYTVPFSFIRWLQREFSFTVWKTADSELRFLGDRLRAEPQAYEMWRQLVRSLVRPAFSQLGWSDYGSWSQRRLRILLLDLACEHGEPECISNMQLLYGYYLRGSR